MGLTGDITENSYHNGVISPYSFHWFLGPPFYTEVGTSSRLIFAGWSMSVSKLRCGRENGELGTVGNLGQIYSPGR